MPVINITSRNPQDFQFKWTAVRTIYALTFIVLEAIQLGLIVFRAFPIDKMTLGYIEIVMFHVFSWSQSVVLFHLATKWRRVMLFWRKKEEIFMQASYEDAGTKMTLKIWIISALTFVMFLGKVWLLLGLKNHLQYFTFSGTHNLHNSESTRQQVSIGKLQCNVQEFLREFFATCKTASDQIHSLSSLWAAAVRGDFSSIGLLYKIFNIPSFSSGFKSRLCLLGTSQTSSLLWLALDWARGFSSSIRELNKMSISIMVKLFGRKFEFILLRFVIWCNTLMDIYPHWFYCRSRTACSWFVSAFLKVWRNFRSFCQFFS